MDSPPPNHGGHILTDEDRRKGQHTKKPGQQIVVSIKNRKKCNTRCFIFELCPLMPLSMSQANTGSPCLLNKGGNALIRRFIKLFVSGEQGLIEEINGILYLYGMDIETAPAEVKKNYAELLMRWHDQTFIKSKREFEEKPQLTIVLKELGGEGKTTSVIPVVEQGPIRLGAKRCAMLNEIVTEAQKPDPDSLLSSDIFDALMDSSTPIKEAISVSEQDSGSSSDESTGTQSTPEKLEKAPESTG